MSKRKRPNLKLKVDSNIAKEEALLDQLHQEDENLEQKSKPKKEKTKRFTMDLPVSLHTRVSDKATSKGQTIKGYLLTLIWKDLEQ